MGSRMQEPGVAESGGAPLSALFLIVLVVVLLLGFLCRGKMLFRAPSFATFSQSKPLLPAAVKDREPATYPQSPFPGRFRCSDVTDLYQAFSQHTGPGRLWLSLSAISLPIWAGPTPQ